MKKKIFIAVLLAAILAGNLFAQEGSSVLANNRIGVSFGLVSAELAYERVFSPNFSVLGSVSYTTWLIADTFSITGIARFYPFAGNFFLEAGLGYSYGYNNPENLANAFLDILLFTMTLGFYTTGTDYAASYESGLAARLGLGWNIDIGKKDGFRLPISIGIDTRLLSAPAIFPYLRLGLNYAF
ncbi:MAG: hypothetical protein FWC01_01685 [Treponema sp.]|nr:hypothetical protein [Treponema sp.]MCL2237976.1 hypothetical protein [Treponema sp.]